MVRWWVRFSSQSWSRAVHVSRYERAPPVERSTRWVCSRGGGCQVYSQSAPPPATCSSPMLTFRYRGSVPFARACCSAFCQCRSGSPDSAGPGCTVSDAKRFHHPPSGGAAGGGLGQSPRHRGLDGGEPRRLLVGGDVVGEGVLHRPGRRRGHRQGHLDRELVPVTVKGGQPQPLPEHPPRRPGRQTSHPFLVRRPEPLRNEQLVDPGARTPAAGCTRTWPRRLGSTP